MRVKNIRFKKKFLNYFYADRFYPDLEFYGEKTEKELSTRYNSPGDYIVLDVLIVLLDF